MGVGILSSGITSRAMGDGAEVSCGEPVAIARSTEAPRTRPMADGSPGLAGVGPCGGGPEGLEIEPARILLPEPGGPPGPPGPPGGTLGGAPAGGGELGPPGFGSMPFEGTLWPLGPPIAFLGSGGPPPLDTSRIGGPLLGFDASLGRRAWGIL